MGPTVQQRAVKQYGKSFERIVWDLSHTGISVTKAAYELGYKCPNAFSRLCKRMGWNEWFLPYDHAKAFTVSDVKQIKKELARAEELRKELAKYTCAGISERWGVSEVSIKNIKQGNSWRHV